MRKAAFHTLGCKVNQYETAMMIREFRDRGYEIVEEHAPADVYVVNSCTVTAVADRKSRQFIRRMRKQNPDSIIVLTGCYSQVSTEAVMGLEEVDIITGTSEKSRIPELVEQYRAERRPIVSVKEYREMDRYQETGSVTDAESRTRASIKIQEGCNRFCTYCVIPYARGRIRSRELDSIRREAEALIRSGYREIVLTGINTALFDMEKGPREGIYGVEKAIAAVSGIPGDFRIRLSSLEPSVVNAEYVRRLLKYEKLCHHMHLSAQSGSDAVLRAMNRPYDLQGYLDIVRVLRDFDPLYGISTDLIVGFPGETEEDFLASCDLTKRCGFVRTHVFPYSVRPFTKAADLPGQIPPPVKKERSRRLQAAGEEAARGFAQANTGRRARILVEEYDEALGMLRGYTDNYIMCYVNLWPGTDPEACRNVFLDVRLREPFRDGMRGEVCRDEA